MASLSPIVRRSTEDQALDVLRDHILTGTAPAASRLTEMGLSDALAISRATVRTALHRLASEGLVLQIPYTGWQVVALTGRDVWELYTLRAPLEGLAARLAADELDQKARYKLEGVFDDLAAACSANLPTRMAACDFALHQAVVDHAGHGRLREQYRLVEQQVRLLIASSNALIADPGDIEAQHRPLLDALLAGDGDSAARLFQEHTLTEGRKLEAAVRVQHVVALDG